MYHLVYSYHCSRLIVGRLTGNRQSKTEEGDTAVSTLLYCGTTIPESIMTSGPVFYVDMNTARRSRSRYLEAIHLRNRMSARFGK